jgi:hypothetical protein
MVRVREAVRPRLRRSDDRALRERQHRTRRARGREQLANRLGAFRVRSRVVGTLVDAERDPLRLRDVGQELRSGSTRATQLEVADGDAAAAEQRAAKVRAPATGSRHHAPRRALQRCQARTDDPGLVQDLHRACVTRYVELVAGLAPERPTAVTPDLGSDAEPAEEAERAPGDA